MSKLHAHLRNMSEQNYKRVARTTYIYPHSKNTDGRMNAVTEGKTNGRSNVLFYNVIGPRPENVFPSIIAFK